MEDKPKYPYPPPVIDRWWEEAGDLALPRSGIFDKFVVARTPARKDAGEHAQHVAAILAERGKVHGYDGKERSMDNIVAIFKSISGVELTIEQGWLFMLALKLGRRLTKPNNMDNYHDAMGYLALLAEHKETT